MFCGSRLYALADERSAGNLVKTLSIVRNPGTQSTYGSGGINNSAGGGIPPGTQDSATFVGTNGTALSSYTTAASATFVQYTGDGVTPQGMPTLNGSGQETLATAGAFGDVLDTFNPTSADYTVGETFTLANPTIDRCALFGRALTGANTNYTLDYNADGISLYSQVAGAAVLLAGEAFTWNNGETHTLTLSMVGTTISAKVDGVDISGSPLTNSAVTAIGHGGSRIFSVAGGGATGTNFYIK